MGAPKGNRNRAIKNKYAGRVVSLSGPKYDVAIDHLKGRGIEEPSNKEVLEAMTTLDWAQFGFEYVTPEDEDAYKQEEEAEKSELATIRADYQWIKECEILPIRKLREIIADGPFPPNEAGEHPKPKNEDDCLHYLKRHRQAIIVLESRGRENND